MGPGAKAPVVDVGQRVGARGRDDDHDGVRKRTDPIFRAIGAELDRRTVPEGPSFVIRPAGTRAQRTKESRRSLGVYKRVGRIGRLWCGAPLSFSRVQLASPLRVLSWIVVAALAWLASPWLVLPAIVASELVWIVVTRWSSTGRRTVQPFDEDPNDQPAP